MNIIPVKTKVFRENENLYEFLVSHLPSLQDGDVLAVTSKIVALAEGRTAQADPAEKVRLIREESEWAMQTKYTWLTVRDGMVMASAGIDESNADGKLVLLPADSFAAAETIRKGLLEYYGLSRLGVILTDSRTLPLRAGVIGVAVGYAGIRAIRNYIGQPDIFGRLMTMSRTDVVDSLAAAAVLEMGEGNEQIPLAVLRGATVEFTDQIDRNELKIALEDDMYRPFFGTFFSEK
jgi:coenzyme F420-0:L-glutamate ligase